MKPLIELVKVFREEEMHSHSSLSADCYRGFDAGMVLAADRLEAWLRETDVWMRECDKECDELGSLREIWAKKIRNELLGTAQKDL